MRGADLVAETLKRAGVRTVFTLSGNQIMPIFDACIDADIRLIHVRHEAAAVYMADAWAQITGEVGVALVTAAPGFANTISALYTARGSESPLVLLSGDSPVGQDGAGAFQELAQADVAAPVTKLAFRARSAPMLGFDVARALRTAQSGRPGPVHLGLPFDLLNATVTDGSVPLATAFQREVAHADKSAALAAADALRGARRPLILTGPALNRSRARSLHEALEAATGVPVVSLESPRGLRDPSLGAFAEVLARADMVLSLGKSIDYTMAFARPPAVDPACGFAVADAEPEMLERAHRALGARLVLAGSGDPDLFGRTLCETPGARERATSGWKSEVADAIAYRGGVTEAVPPETLAPWTICEAVQSVLSTAKDPILIADGGEFGQWAQAFLTAPTRLINGPAGAIGGGLCYAVAAKLARPDATVVAVMGDGTAGFHFTEFDTAVRYEAAFTAVIGNDARWNAEHMIQLRDYGENRLVGCELNPTRYDRAAAGLGCHGEHVDTANDLAAALDRAVRGGRPACVNVVLDGRPAPTFTRTGKAAAGAH